MSVGDGELLAGLPQPLARAWSAVLATRAPEAQQAACAALDADLAMFVRRVAHIAQAAGDDALARWAADMRPDAALAPASDLARTRLRAKLEGFLAPGAPRLVAIAGAWAVRLAGPSATMDAHPDGGTFRLGLATSTQVHGLGSLGTYDAEADHVHWSLEEPARGSAATPRSETRAALDLWGVHTAPAPGQRFATFRLLRVVKAGAQGVLYEAEPHDLPHTVALKVLHPHLVEDETAVRRMQAEAQTLAKIPHKNVVRVFGAGFSEGRPWLSMHFIRGPSLDDVLETLSRRPTGRTSEAAWLEAVSGRAPAGARTERGSSWRRIALMGRDIAQALSECHVAQLVHRDVKPANLMFDADGEVLLTDFGLASSAAAPTLTGSDQVVGTPQYIAPESLKTGAERELDPRSDTYALGATLYEALALRRPFADHEGDPLALFKAILTEPPRPLLDVAPSTPVDLATIVMKCLEKEPSARYVSAGALADDLDRLLSHRAIKAKPPGFARLALQAMRRYPKTSIVAGAILMLAGTLTYFALENARVSEESRVEGREQAVRTARRQKLDAVRAALTEMSTSHVASSGQYVDTLFQLIRLADEEAVTVIAGALDEVTTELEQALEAAGPVEPGETGLKQQLQAQSGRLAGGLYRRALTCAEVLGRIGIVDVAVVALERHLTAERAPDGLRESGIALARLCSRPGGERAEQALARVMLLPHVAEDAAWSSIVRSHLSRALPGSTLAHTGPPPPAPPRRPHGLVPDPRTKAVLLVPVIVESWMGLGKPQDNRFDLREVLQRNRRMVEAEPRRAELWIELGRTHAHRGELVDACAAFANAIELDPARPDPWTERAACRRHLGEYQGALRDLAEARRLAPEASWPLFLHGLTRADMGELEGALLELGQGVARHPDRAFGYSYTSMTHYMLGDGKAAELSARKAVALEPKSSENWICVACALLAQGDLAGAKDAADEGLKHGPGYTMGWNTLGALQYLMGQEKEAEASFRAALRTGAALPYSWNNLGVVLLARGDAKQARAHFEFAIQATPRLSAPWLGLALAAEALGDAEGAKRARATHAALSTPAKPR